MRRILAIVVFPILLLVVAQGLNHVRDGMVALDGKFIGLDGYTHLLRAKELWNGAAWTDHRIHRGNPPEGDELYWPRPFDLVLLAGALPLTPIMGFDAALHAWGIFVSPALHLLSLFVLLWAARPLFDDRGLFYLGVLFAFQLFIVHMASVARPDHHSLLGLLFIWLVGAGLRLVSAEGGAGAALRAALPAVLSMWISLESLVATAACFVALGVGWITVREDFARKGAVFALALAGGFALTLLIEHGLAGLTEPHYDAPSPVHLALFVMTALVWLALLALDRLPAVAGSAGLRLAASIAGAIAVVGLMRLLLPKFFLGPLAEIDSKVVAEWFDYIAEYKPMIDPRHLRASLPLFLFHLGSALLAVPFMLYRIVRGSGFERRAWLWLLLLGVAYVALSANQQRWANFAQYVVVIPYAALLLAWTGGSEGTRSLLGAARRAGFVVLFLFGFPLVAGLMYKPRAAAAPSVPCPLTAMSRWIDGEPELNTRTHRILSFINFGPELLYRTKHEVIATPNHRNGASVLDAINALGRLPPEEAHAVIARRGVDLVLVCRGTEEATDYRSGNGGNTLFVALENGRAPDWLKPVTLPPALAQSFVLAEVVR
jgi:hypothetical protein